MADKQMARKRKLEADRRHRVNTEMEKLRRVVDEAEPGLAVAMQQADILEQARLLICKLQKQAAELEQQLKSSRDSYVTAYQLGREHFQSEALLVAQLPPQPPPQLPLQLLLQLLQLQSQPTPTTEPTDPNAQME